MPFIGIKNYFCQFNIGAEKDLLLLRIKKKRTYKVSRMKILETFPLIKGGLPSKKEAPCPLFILFIFNLSCFFCFFPP
jgi:hypothetical protein